MAFGVASDEWNVGVHNNRKHGIAILMQIQLKSTAHYFEKSRFPKDELDLHVEYVQLLRSPTHILFRMQGKRSLQHVNPFRDANSLTMYIRMRGAFSALFVNRRMIEIAKNPHGGGKTALCLPLRLLSRR